MNTCVCVRAYGHQTNKRADRKEEIKTLLRWAREAPLCHNDTVCVHQVMFFWYDVQC